MSHALYEHLEKAGLLRRGRVRKSTIANMSIKRLLDLAEESASLSSAPYGKRSNSIFSYSASMTLGGSAWPCSFLGCRLNTIKKLAQFAAFYADSVLIRNPFAAHAEDHHGNRLTDPELLRLAIHDDLTIMVAIRDLVDNQKVIPVSMPHLCPHCLGAAGLGEKRYNSVAKRLRSLFLKHVSVKVKLEHDAYTCDWNCPESLLSHGGGIAGLKSLPQDFKTMSGLLRRLNSGEELTLSRMARSRLGLHNMVADQVLEDVEFQLGSMFLTGTSFVTDMPLHADILNSITPSRTARERNTIIRQHLTAIVPYVQDVPIRDLLRLRRREPEAFILFRQSLNDAVDEVRRAKGDFTDRDARAIHGDILAPKLALLDAKVKSARRGLVKSTAKKAAAWAGAITFGMYAGVVPSDYVAAASALGLTQVVADLATGLAGSGEAKEQMRSEDMYFLWRVREKTKKR